MNICNWFILLQAWFTLVSGRVYNIGIGISHTFRNQSKKVYFCASYYTRFCKPSQQGKRSFLKCHLPIADAGESKTDNSCGSSMADSPYFWRKTSSNRILGVARWIGFPSTGVERSLVAPLEQLRRQSGSFCFYPGIRLLPTTAPYTALWNLVVVKYRDLKAAGSQEHSYSSAKGSHLYPSIRDELLIR